MVRRLLVTLTCVAVSMVMVSQATANAPDLMNYQGRMTNAAGLPITGTRDITFTIYDHPTNPGTVLWQETHTGVPITNGLFNVIFGQGNPPVAITEAVFDNDVCWLGIQVGADPEMVPRIRLVTAGYSHRVSTVDEATGGIITGNVNILGNLDIGSSSMDRGIYLWRNGTFAPTVEIQEDPYAGDGGSIWLYDENLGDYFSINPDGDGDGGYMWIENGYGGIGFLVDGNYNGTSEPSVEIDGSARDVIFNMSLSGDASVSLPDDAVSAVEILDEPGIASANITGAVVITSTTVMTDVETVSLTTPTSGYIVLEAKCYARLSGTTGMNEVYLQIDENSGGSWINPHVGRVGGAAFPSTGTYRYMPSTQRVYYKSQGTYTFRLEGMVVSGSSGSVSIWNPTLTATFYPTSYGSVATIVASSEASQFDIAEAITADFDEGMESAEQLYEVDLRELELKAARLKEELDQVQREIDERSHQQETGADR